MIISVIIILRLNILEQLRNHYYSSIYRRLFIFNCTNVRQFIIIIICRHFFDIL